MQRAPKREGGIPQLVQEEVNNLLQEKGVSELDDLAGDIAKSLQDDDEDVETEFYEAVQEQIPLFRARAR